MIGAERYSGERRACVRRTLVPCVARWRDLFWPFWGPHVNKKKHCAGLLFALGPTISASMPILHDSVLASPTTSSIANARILCVEDDPEIARLLTDVLEDSGFTPCFVGSATNMDAVLT